MNGRDRGSFDNNGNVRDVESIGWITRVVCRTVGLFKYFFTSVICSLFGDLCVFNTKVLGQQGVICLLYKNYRLRCFEF